MRAKPWIGTDTLARRLQIHPNTLRWYESAGYIMPVPRTPGGQRMFYPEQQLQVHFLRHLFKIHWMYGPIRDYCFCCIHHLRSANYHILRQQVYELQLLLRRESDLAHRAIRIIDAWLGGAPPVGAPPAGSPPACSSQAGAPAACTPSAVDSTIPSRGVKVTAAARLCDISPHRIRNWDRNGMLQLERDQYGHRILFPRNNFV